MQTAIKTAQLGLREYKNPTKIIKFQKDIRTQLLEQEGKVEFGKGLYHNNNYEQLVQFLTQSRQQYRESNSLEERQKIAQQEYKKWSDYIETRKSDIPEELQITEKQTYQLKQIWDLVKGRKERYLKSESILEFHNEYAKKFKFDILIDPKCLVQMIHPHHGYLSQFPGHFEFDQLIELYNKKLVATIERQQGQDLLADEISSFIYWNQFDKAQQGHMNNFQFLEFLKVFKFDLQSIEQFQNEFQFAYNLNKGESNQQLSQEEGSHRFDFFRYIFLERNL